MSISRRSIVQTLGALPAALYLSGCRQTAAPSPRVATIPPVPSPKSIFVIFAGPWLIYQSDPTNKILTALTVDDSMSGHKCVTEKWRNNVLNPDPSTYPDLNTDKTGATITTASAAMADDFVTAFTNPFTYNPFAWVRYTSGLGTPVVNRRPERSVTLPLPTGIYIGGFLLHATVSANMSGVLKGDTFLPHVVTIFEYAPALNGTVSMSLTMPGAATPYPFQPGDHLVFRVRHDGCTDDAAHVKMTFAYLTSHFTKNPLNPIAFNQDDTKFLPGDYTAGIGPDEMGLGYDCVSPNGELNATNDTYANCAGSGIIVGP